MIREITSSDRSQMHELFNQVGLFNDDEVLFMLELVDNYNGKVLGENHFIIANDDNGINGAAYYAPEAFGDGVYNLYFIGILPEARGKEIGKKMVEYIEDHLRKLEARMLLIETSGKASFERTWNFYLKNGYHKEATIFDYYSRGDDKLIFKKNF